MGKILMRWPLKWQFIFAFALILILSAAATALTVASYVYLYSKLEYSGIYPANHYEKQIPSLNAYLREQGDRLLNPEREELLQAVIPTEGIRYQVINSEGRVLYGTDQRKILNSREQLRDSINTTIRGDGEYKVIIPLFGENSTLAGGVVLMYNLSPTYASKTDQFLFAPLYMFLFLSPFIYIILFAFLFARLLANNMGKPLRQLIQAAKQIKNKDLNFTIDYAGSNELGQLSEAFRDMRAELEASLISQWRMEQERLDLMENLAHDIKTPLAIIRGYADSLLLEQSDSKDKWQKYISVIKENAIRGSSYIEHMQLPADSQPSAFSIHYTYADLSELLKRKTDNYKLLASQKEIDVRLKMGGCNPEKSFSSKRWVDVGKLERILDNIVLNGIRHTPQKGSIRLEAVLREDGCTITVCDTGEGFSDGDLPHLFDRLYRGNGSAQEDDYAHCGRGLYIAKQLAEIHGGEIRARNNECGGACVEFDLAFGGPKQANE
ncbi:HAMP domain-containing sensor histidine kinase [Paenibacillus oryzae]|nr:HAMP domain-containing sensor histidine kinase [Paenibacillus oryzae]